jgi:hypothetical protein
MLCPNMVIFRYRILNMEYLLQVHKDPRILSMLNETKNRYVGLT